MTVDDYPSKYPGFFDLDFVRRTVTNTKKMSDGELLATILDPKNTSPHNPNCIFDGQFYSKTYLTGKEDKGKNPILHYLAHGVLEGAKPSLLFDPDFFRKNAGAIADQFPTLVEYALSCTQDTIPAFHPFIDVQYLSRTLNEKGHENFLEAIFLSELKGANPHPLTTQYGQITKVDRDDPLRHYFRSSLYERQRVLIALESLEENLQNRTWLSLLENQFRNVKIEFIVVALKDGALTPSFADNAQIWILADEVKDIPSLEDVMESGRLLVRNLLSNTPCVAFVEVKTSALLLLALSAISTKKIVFGGSGMVNLKTEDLNHISLFADKVLCEREREKKHLEKHFADQPSFVEAGFRPALPASLQSTDNNANKRDIRASLGLPEETIIVLSSGAMELENGIDIFGALAAKYCSHPNNLDNVHFIWHGNGRKHPNSPWFYAQYFVEMAAGKGRIQSTNEFSLDDMIANADVYFNHPRNGSFGDGIEKAQAAGVAVMRAEKQIDDASTVVQEGAAYFEPFELDAACDILLNLCADPNQREQLSAAARHDIETGGKLDNFIEQIKNILVKIDVPDNFEVVTASDLLLLVLDKDIAGPLSKLNGAKSTLEGRKVALVETSSFPSKGIPKQLYEFVQNCDCAKIAIHFGMANLEAEYVSHFSKALCLTKGSSSQIEDLYRFGLGFEKILVEDVSAINNMSAMNPQISALMLAVEGD